MKRGGQNMERIRPRKWVGMVAEAAVKSYAPSRVQYRPLSSAPLNSGDRSEETHCGQQCSTNVPFPQGDSCNCSGPVGYSSGHFGAVVSHSATAV